MSPPLQDQMRRDSHYRLTGVISNASPHCRGQDQSLIPLLFARHLKYQFPLRHSFRKVSNAKRTARMNSWDVSGLRLFRSERALLPEGLRRTRLRSRLWHHQRTILCHGEYVASVVRSNERNLLAEASNTAQASDLSELCMPCL